MLHKTRIAMCLLGKSILTTATSAATAQVQNGPPTREGVATHFETDLYSP